VRFIEYMDVGGATGWDRSSVVTREEILRRLGGVRPLGSTGDGARPARRYVRADGTTFGVIASVTRPFCDECDRARLTADGLLVTCLYATSGLDLRRPLRAGRSDPALRALIGGRWSQRRDRAAQERAGLEAHRGPLADLVHLRRHPHLEMHTRGG